MPQKKMEEVVENIYMEPVPITVGDEIRIKYKGVLTSQGANKIYLHCGYGSGNWERIEDIPMRKTRDGGWSVRLPIIEASSLNFCFRDDAQNWDNNYGRNWTYQIHNGDRITH